MESTSVISAVQTGSGAGCCSGAGSVSSPGPASTSPHDESTGGESAASNTGADLQPLHYGWPTHADIKQTNIAATVVSVCTDDQ